MNFTSAVFSLMFLCFNVHISQAYKSDFRGNMKWK